MTKLTCSLAHQIKSDFSDLWQCKQRGDTIEITTPYLLPDNTLFSLFITKRQDRFIVCDNGSITEILEEHCPLPDSEIKVSVGGFASKFEIKTCVGGLGKKLFYKECTKRTHVSSAAFDMLSFATASTNALVAATFDEPNAEPDTTFRSEADSFIKSALPSEYKIHPRHEIREIPGVKFSVVVKKSSRLWIISYVTGHDLTNFNKSIGVTKMNFEHAWQTSLGRNGAVGATIPLVNTEASGYKALKLKWQMNMLNASAHDSLITWPDREQLSSLIGRN